jgi:uncharacterized lipoprotein YbaY
VLVNLMLLAGPLHAASNAVTGNLQFKEKVALSPSAVAIITLADRNKDATAGTIIGQQRIDGATGNDAFSVPFDPAIINTKHAYTIYASLIDGGKSWQSLLPIPVITGGPTDGLVVPLGTPTAQTPAQITGTIATPPDVTVSPAAVAYATIINATTGRLVNRQVIPPPTTFPIPFTVPFDAALFNPENTYVAAAGIIDGTTLYQTAAPTPIDPNAPAPLALTVAKTSTVIPGPATPTPEVTATPEATPTATPTPAETPTATPTPVVTVPPGETPTPTPKPTKTPKPTATPTETPSPTPTETPSPTPTASPTPTPTPTPTASPSPTPTASPSPTPTPTPAGTASAAPSGSVAPTAEPTPITVTGSATYKEPYQLSNDAVFEVAVVQVDPNGPTVVAVGHYQKKNPGQQPLAFSVPLDPALLVATSDTWLYATLVDGTNAWTSAAPVPVATNGAPISDVQVPLTFRPDLIEGEVTGAITGLPSDIGLDAWAMAFVLDQSDGTVLGLQSGAILGSTFVPFSVPFLIENLDPTKTYVAGATVFDDTRTFRSEAGVPVITNGNPYSGINLAVIEINPSPSPTATPAATPAPTAPPTAAPTTAPTTAPAPSATPGSSTGGGGGIDPLVLAGVLALAVIGVIVVAVVLRR